MELGQSHQMACIGSKQDAIEDWTGGVFDLRSRKQARKRARSEPESEPENELTPIFELQNKTTSKITTTSKDGSIDLSFEGGVIYLSNTILKTMVDKSLQNMVRLARSMIVKYRGTCPEGILQVDLFGWGSLAPYVLDRYIEELSKEYSGIDIKLRESQECPSIADGAFISAARDDLVFSCHARNGVGVVSNIRATRIPKNGTNYREVDQNRSADGPDEELVLGRCLWPLEMGIDLDDYSKPLIVQGTQRLKIENPKKRFPVPWDLDLVASGTASVFGDDRFRPAQNAINDKEVQKLLTIPMEIHAKTCGMKNARMDQGYLEFDSRVRIRRGKLQPAMIIIIPKSGWFEEDFEDIAADWTEDYEACATVVVPLPPHIHPYAAMKSLDEALEAAGWPVRPKAESLDQYLKHYSLDDWEENVGKIRKFLEDWK